MGNICSRRGGRSTQFTVAVGSISCLLWCGCKVWHANKLTVHILAAVAQLEREMIAQRTKDALRAAKARDSTQGTFGRGYCQATTTYQGLNQPLCPAHTIRGLPL